MGSNKRLIPELKSVMSLIRFRNIVIGSATVLTGSFVTIQVPWNNELILNIEPGISFISADITRTKQIVLNLISNAAKFSEYGQISIDVKAKKSSSKELVTIDVKDSGIGMTQEQIDKLFHAFTQADASGVATDTPTLASIAHGDLA